MSTSIELYTMIKDYLDGRITLAQLELWLTPRLCAVLSAPDSDIASVVGTIELCLAEVGDGIRSERSAKAFLRKQLADRLSALVASEGYDTTIAGAGTISGSRHN